MRSRSDCFLKTVPAHKFRVFEVRYLGEKDSGEGHKPGFCICVVKNLSSIIWTWSAELKCWQIRWLGWPPGLLVVRESSCDLRLAAHTYENTRSRRISYQLEHQKSASYFPDCSQYIHPSMKNPNSQLRSATSSVCLVHNLLRRSTRSSLLNSVLLSG